VTDAQADERLALAIVGAGAAGLMAGITAGRAAGGGAIACFDGAATIGRKILIAGGGRCNVTHDVVDEGAFAGASPHAIRKVLRRFEVSATVSFFRELGVELVREDTGKLFPASNRARTVLDALAGALQAARVGLRTGWRVEAIERAAEGFLLHGTAGRVFAERVILATGGRSVPQTGSDGHGYVLAEHLGHSVTRVWPALVPLTLPREHALTTLAGVTVPVRLTLETATGKRLIAIEGSLVITHGGLSGPAVLDMSRHWIEARRIDPTVRLVASWVPGASDATIDALLRGAGSAGAVRRLHPHMPERLARTLCALAAVDGAVPPSSWPKTARRTLVRAVTALELPLTGDRGFGHAEVTAGGVPLAEIRLETMESRVCPGLYLCGEICDVDGRIGGYNFQWAWASGFVAGTSAAGDRAAGRSASA
jgi:hypothetical protein